MATNEATGSLLPAPIAEAMGNWSEWKTAYPISTADIRRWAVNAYWPEQPPRLFVDEDYAKTTRWKGIIAPQEFNPFAWTMEAQYPKAEGPRAGAILKQEGFQVLNGGQADEFGEMIRPGDVIRSRSRLSTWEQKPTRFGETLFITTEEVWLNQRDELVRRRLSTSAAYRPGSNEGASDE